MKNCQGYNESQTDWLMGEERKRLEGGRTGLERSEECGG